MRDQLEFFRQFRARNAATGSLLPSSRFLASAMTGPLARAAHPVRVLEIGPGTGAVTRRIVRLLRPGDRFDLIELNDTFADILRAKFRTDDAWRAVSGFSAVHCLPLQEFREEAPYDIVISGLPTTNFDVPLVREVFAAYVRLLAPGGTLSFFEYMFLRSIRKRVWHKADRVRLTAMDEVIAPYFAQLRFARSWVFGNFPPAWVHHLRKDPSAPDDGTATDAAPVPREAP